MPRSSALKAEPAVEQAKLLKRTRRDKAVEAIAALDDPAVLAQLAEIDARFDTAVAMAANPATPEAALWVLHRRALASLLEAPNLDDRTRVLEASSERLDPEAVRTELARANAAALEATYNGGRHLFPFKALLERLLQTPGGHFEKGEWVAHEDLSPSTDRLGIAASALREGPDVLAFELARLVCEGRVPGLDLTALLHTRERPEVVLAAAHCTGAFVLEEEAARAFVRHASAWHAYVARFDHFDPRGWRRLGPTPEAAHVLVACEAEWARLWAVLVPLQRADRMLVSAAKSSSLQLLVALATRQELDSDEVGTLLGRALALRARHEADPLLRALVVQERALPAERSKMLAVLAKHGNPGPAVNWLQGTAAGPLHETISAPRPGEIGLFAKQLTVRAAGEVVARLGDGGGLLAASWCAEALDQLPMLCAAPSAALRAALLRRLADSGLGRDEAAALRGLLVGWEGSLASLLNQATRRARMPALRARGRKQSPERERRAAPTAPSCQEKVRPGRSSSAGRATPPAAGKRVLAGSAARRSATLREGTRPTGGSTGRRRSLSAAGTARWIDVALLALEAREGELSAGQILEWNDTDGPRRPHNGKTPAQTINRDLHAAIRAGDERLVHGSRRGTFRLLTNSPPLA